MGRGAPQGLKYATRNCPDCGKLVKTNYFARHQRSKCVLGGHEPAAASLDHTGLVNQDEAATIADMAPSTFRWYAGQARVLGQREGSIIWYTLAEVQTVTVCRQNAIRRRMAEPRRPAPRPASTCAICGRPLQQHPRCRACGILMGPGHEEQGAGDVCVGCQPGYQVQGFAWEHPACHRVGALPRFGRPSAGE